MEVGGASEWQPLFSIGNETEKYNQMRHLLYARALVLLIAYIFGSQASAHEIRPAIATALFNSDGTYKVTIKVSAEVLLAGIDPGHEDTRKSPQARLYEELRALPREELANRFRASAKWWLDGIEITFNGIRAKPELMGVEVPAVGDLALPRITTLTLSGRTPSGMPTFRWRYDRAFGSSVLRVKRADDGTMLATWLKNGEQSEPVPVIGAPRKGALKVFGQYLSLGFTHILPFGLDHILFVLGLYLLSAHLRPLLIQVTSFTVAHSVTLGLGLFGVVSVSPSVVEPLIAASIVFVALENFVTDRMTPWRPYVVFGFGLMHGLGFAGVLHEIGIAQNDLINCLIAFNVGVELGQLTVIMIAFLATGLWFRGKSWYRSRIVQPISILIGLLGAFWFVERVIV